MACHLPKATQQNHLGQQSQHSTLIATQLSISNLDLLWSWQLEQERLSLSLVLHMLLSVVQHRGSAEQRQQQQQPWQPLRTRSAHLMPPSRSRARVGEQDE